MQPLALVERPRERRRPAHKLGELRPCALRLELEGQRGLAPWRRREPERDLEDDPELPLRARHQAKGVEAGDVLEHLAAESQSPATTVEHGDAQHAVAHSAGERPPGPREPRRHYAPD